MKIIGNEPIFAVMRTLIDEEILELGLMKDDTTIVKMLSFGKTTAEIGGAISMNNRTVEGRVLRLRRKTKTNSIAALVAFFIRKGIIE